MNLLVPRGFLSLFQLFLLLIKFCVTGLVLGARDTDIKKAILCAFKAHAVFSMDGNIKRQMQDSVMFAKWKPAQVLMCASKSVCRVPEKEQIELTLKEMKFSGR